MLRIRHTAPGGPSPADLVAPSPEALGIAGFPSFRAGQFSIAADIATSSTRFRLLSAPTGTGKSLIYRTASVLAGASRTLVLVDTKPLQDQLTASFAASGMVDVRGHGNYSCARTSFSPDDELLDLECHARRDGACLYDAAVARACDSSVVVTNVANWISIALADDPGRFGDFDLLIIDEAHGTPFRVPELLSVTLRGEALARFGLAFPDDPARATPAAWRDWAAVASYHLGAYADRLQQREKDSARARPFSGFSSPDANRAELVRLRALTRTLDRLVRMARIESSPSAWVTERGERRDEYKLTPVWSAPFNEEFLFRGIPTVILSSATLSRSIPRYMGIEPVSFSYHETDSLFPVERRPFIYVPTARIDRRTMEDPGVAAQFFSRIDQIAARRTHVKGVIHSGSYDRAHEIVSRSKFRASMITHEKGGLQDAMGRFSRAAAGAILVSPAVEEGIDFAGDLARWQHIPKLPLINSSNILAKARDEQSDKGYSAEIAGQRLTQIYGRNVRSEGDWGETLLTDDHWRWFQDKIGFALWFKRAWRETRIVPDALRVAS